jgi:hypothetical protein
MANTLEELASPQTANTDSRSESQDQNFEREAMLDVFEALLADAERITNSRASDGRPSSNAVTVSTHNIEQS